MQNDSMKFSTSGHISPGNHQAGGQDATVKYYQCGQCELMLTSKVFLFEHLTKVHDSDVDSALKTAGLKHVDNNSSGGPRADFKSSNWDNLKDHLGYCTKKSDKPGPKGNVGVSQNEDAKETAGSERDDESPPSGSPSKKQPSPNSSKDLKTYKRSTQTITKFLVATSGSNRKSPDSLSDGSQETLLLQESPSSSSPKNSGVFQVTAKPTIDVSKFRPHCSLQNDALSVTKIRKTNAKEEGKEEVRNNVGKRTREDGSIIFPPKKAKLDDDAATLSEKENSGQHQSARGFPFDVSEDEGESRVTSAEADVAVFFCKHCDYSDEELRGMSTHYRNDHPYVRYSAAYIQDPSNTSATFRCLECPVEFFSTGLLSRHYLKHHPDAPDVFTLKSGQLGLGYKCFQCPFTAALSETLKEHYGEKHQMLKVGNSLLFYRYSTARLPKEPSEPGECEKPSGTDKAEGPPAEEDARSFAALPQQPGSKGADVALYECSACAFSHKSVVVMHVHYQRSHPEEAMTIDKIKQLARLASPTENSTPPKSPADSSRKAKEEDAASPRRSSSLSSDSARNHSRSLKSKDGESAKDRKKKKKSSSKRDLEKSAEEDLPDDPSGPLYYCQFCSFKSSQLRSVAGHHNAKHSMHTRVSVQKIIKYSAAVRKKKAEKKALRFKSSPSSQPKASKPAPGRDEASGTEGNAYAHPENLFYCLKCNYANTTAIGVLNHQAKLHSGPYSTCERIVQYSALVREEIAKSEPQPEESSFPSRLPLPLMGESDRLKFFCHFCNYRHESISHVLRHCSKSHRGYGVRAEEIERYTSVVLERTQGSKETGREILEKREKAKKLSPASTLLSADASPPKRALQCATCSYNTPFVYLLRRHSMRTHRRNLSITEVLSESFRQGALQAGYHCEFCLFNSEGAEDLYRHYKKQHPKRKLSLEYVESWLHAGPQALPQKNKKPMFCDAENGGGAADSPPSPWRPAETYPCSECSFKGDSISSITRHFRVAHPWSKENSEAEDLEDGPFDSYQVPLEFDKLTKEAAATLGKFKCSYCPAVMSSQRGLSTHCGMKHQEMVTKNVEVPKKAAAVVKPRVHVFKCPYCAYVNTIYQGILTHCQKKHPDLTLRADSLHVDANQVQNLEDKAKDRSGAWKFSGLMCLVCSLVCSTADGLNRHREDAHSERAASGGVRRPLEEAWKSDTAKVPKLKISKVSLLNAKKYSKVRCQHCPFKCSTNASLSRHMYAHHAKYAASKNCVYKCVLCSKSYNWKKHLACHYIMKHGRESYVKHYVPLYKHASLKVRLFQPHDDDASDSKMAAEEPKLLVFRCPSCPYANASHHGTLTHCQMKHPTVLARADDLQTFHVSMTDMVRCSKGRGSNQRGYMCDDCPQIHGSLNRLLIHCKRDHHRQQGLFKGGHKAKRPTAGAVEIKEEKIESAIEAGQPSPLAPPATKLYTCQMCSYRGLHRRYLQSHYKNSHKLDPKYVMKLLQKYNKLKRRNVPQPPEDDGPGERAEHACKRCPDAAFASAEQLLDHYETLHGLHRKLDFIVLSTGERKKTTGLYRCSYCWKQLNGTRKVHVHLDNHRRQNKEEARNRATPGLLSPKVEPSTQDEEPAPEPWAGKSPAEWSASGPSPVTSPPKLEDADQPEREESESDLYTCRQCWRSFRSLKGLRTHEHSHAAVAAIKKLNVCTAAPDSSYTKYMNYKSGHKRPFVCTVCSYRTTVMGLWWSHFLKKHQDVILNSAKSLDDGEDSAERSDTEPLDVSRRIRRLDDPHEEPAVAKSSLYLEPPDVRRQLNHYSMVAQRSARAEAHVLPDDSLLHCEMCTFTTEHSSSIRRHYLNRHGKKILRCKDCEFFTGSRKTLELHMEMGHSTYQSMPTYQKDLRCPFCLYQTKNKNNMIDHIILHREERVVPIEVRRPKLSRYLRGVVFRCHKCTFTSSSEEGLRLHVARHDDVRPYKCRLCFFDGAQLSDLEEHLSDKHQVLRNHELVGQVSLDELDARVGRTTDKEEEPLSTSERCSDHSEESLTDCSDVPQTGKQNEGPDGNGENPGKTEIDTTEQEKHRQRTQAGSDSEKGEKVQLKKLKESERLKLEKEDQLELGGNEDGASDESYSRTAKEEEEEEEEIHKLHVKEMEASIEDDILRNILELDADRGPCGNHKESDPDRTAGAGSIGEIQDADADLNDASSPDRRSSVAAAQSHELPALAKIADVQTNSTKARKSLASNPRSFAPSPSVSPRQPELSREDGDGEAEGDGEGGAASSSSPCRQGPERSRRDGEEVLETSREMPVLENEYLKDEMHLHLHRSHEGEGDGGGPSEGGAAKSGEERDGPNALEATGERRFTCELCGRNLVSSSELKRHTMRHGM